VVIAVLSTASFTTAPSHEQHTHSSSLIRRTYRFPSHFTHTPYQQRPASSTPNPTTPHVPYLSPNPLPNPHRPLIRQPTRHNSTSTRSLQYHPHDTSSPFPLLTTSRHSCRRHCLHSTHLRRILVHIFINLFTHTIPQRTPWPSHCQSRQPHFPLTQTIQVLRH